MRAARRLSFGGAWMAGLGLGCTLAAGSPMVVRVLPVPLAPDGVNRVGELEYRGGVALSSPDKRVGGLSDLRVSPDGRRLTAITDEGHWFTTLLRYDARGFLEGVEGSDVGPLRGPSGDPLEGKVDQDAEALAALPDGSFVVAFERKHRLCRYPPTRLPLRGVPTLMTPPPDLGKAPGNEGIESLAVLTDGRLFALSEDLAVEGGVRGWVGGASGWQPLVYAVSGILRPSSAARLPSGDVLVLIRGYSVATGVVVALERVPRSDIVPGAVLHGRRLAELRPPLTVDNFEGVEAREGKDGEALVYLLSDDNFSRIQRTLLMMFALRDGD